MEGKPVFKWALRAVEETIRLVVERSDLALDDIDHFFFHQANIRIIDAVCDNLGVDKSKVVNNIQRYGNTSAASIPLALDEAVTMDKVKRGDHLLLTGFGAGLTWGTGVFRW
jgi:3-oxoacyl-[acyl-carrier-protein] synthase-3